MAPNDSEVAVDLVTRIGHDDRTAEEELCRRYGPGLMFMLRRRTGDLQLAEDLHQAAFIVVLERLRGKGLDDPAGLVPFIHGVAKKLIAADIRKRVRRQTDVSSAIVDQAAEPSSGQISDVMRQQLAALVRRLIEELDNARDRQLLLRFYIDEDDKQEICRDLDLSDVHFNRVMYRARQRFKEMLLQHGAMET